MHLHFIAIGGAAMHNLALTLHQKGFVITGSDDEIFEPSLSRLKEQKLLPKEMGWDAKKIDNTIDAIILGMHAREDNPELIKAKELGLPIYSYPEYLYEQTKDKTRVVIGGSHGKTTITSMVMHVLKFHNIKFDYMVGASVEGFDTMVSLSHDAKIAVFEGDEYLSSPIDRTPKFLKYKPHIALLSGIAWDHINVFPTWDNYVEQFQLFVDSIDDMGTLIYYNHDSTLNNIASKELGRLQLIPYSSLPHSVKDGVTFLQMHNKDIAINVFGEHNLQNMHGAMEVCKELGISNEEFSKAIQSFKGASKRLQEIFRSEQHVAFLDFAHSPSKLKATVEAVKSQFPNRKLVACMELHTFSSLSKQFLHEYSGGMDAADIQMVYFNPEVIEHKKLTPITIDEVKNAFGNSSLQVFTDSKVMKENLQKLEWANSNLLFMSSGTFSGINFKEFAKELLNNS